MRVIAKLFALALFGCLLAANEAAANDPQDAIVDYIAAHPGASLEDVVAFANSRITDSGLVYYFDHVASAPALEIVLVAGTQEIRFPVSDEFSACGERWVRVPAIGVDADSIDIPRHGEIVHFPRPRDLRLELHTTRATPHGDVIATFEVPWQSVPYAVSNDGRIEFIRYMLPAKVAPWWDGIRQQHPDITETTPILLLAFGQSSPRFVSDPEIYRSHPTEPLPVPDEMKSGYAFRWRFRDSGIIIDFEAPCT
jgi:hypothetical protein